MIRAELLKAWSTRSLWLLVAVGLVSCAGWAALDVLVFLGDAPSAREVEGAYSMASQGYLFVLVVGVLVVAGEYRHRTVTWLLLVEPRRGRVLAGKLAACGVLGLAVGLAAVVVTTPVAAVLLAVAGHPVVTAGVPLALLGSVLSTVLWTMLGGALGALVRNQVAATVIAFVWFYYAEWALVMLVPAVGRWTPTGAAKAVSGWTRDAMPVAGELLPMWLGGLLLLAYAGVAAVAAGRLSTRRDVT